MEVSSAGPSVVVRPIGELDIAAAAELREALLTACASTTDQVVVDCSEVTFIDSTALGVLAACAKRLNTSGHHLSIRHASTQVRRAIALAGLSDFLGVEAPGS